MYLKDIKVYLGNDVEPTEIYGLLPIVQQRIENSDAGAFVNNSISHKPFIDGFQNGITIGTLVDTLAQLSRNTPDTNNIVKNFTLYIDPPKDNTFPFQPPPTQQQAK